ncbi:MAG: PHP domain-containing protein, partial [Clostridia bacterium]|nr:PHP domain-containing protein [Clostridia bacterium]
MGRHVRPIFMSGAGAQKKMNQDNTEENALAEPFDLHLHSSYSDGSDTPAEVVRAAYARGVTLLALTDHDNVLGVPEALAEAERIGVRLLPSIEMDAEWPHEMHILGIDIDINEQRMKAALVTALKRRGERNAVIVDRLLHAGCDIRGYLSGEIGAATRLNIALALVKGGYVADTKEAFAKYLRKGCPGFYTVKRFTPEEIIQLILGAGGVPVWAHPMNGHADPHKIAPMLKELGLMGMEAYHPSLSEGDTVVITSIARQLDLIVTCGSDYHGA